MNCNFLYFFQLEKEIKEEVIKWEADNEQQFLVNGGHYTDMMVQQWENMKLKKEQMKLERVTISLFPFYVLQVKLSWWPCWVLALFLILYI